MTTLLDLREKIDALDSQLLQLLNQRAEIAVEVGHIKAKTKDPNVYNPAREKEVLSRLMQDNPGPLKETHVENIFKSVISSCRSLEQNMKIAFLGPEGSFCHLALLKHFGNDVDPIPAKTISDAIHILENNRAEFAVVPVENSTEGVVNETLDTLVNSSVKIMGEVILPIRHHLWGNLKNSTSDKIYGHPQALAQCQKFLREYYSDAAEVAVYSTALGVKKVKAEGLGLAIGSDLAGALYGLEAVAENIQDSTNNQTRFIVLGKKDVKPTGKDKTSMLVMNIPNETGSLVKLLEPFSDLGINISLPSLRPSRDEAWHYIFYFDLMGHENDSKVKEALTILKQFAMVKILGSYPSGSLVLS